MLLCGSIEMIRHMVEDHESAIRETCTSRPVDETVGGRVAGLDADTRAVYLEMNDLLTGRITGISPEEYAARLYDLVELLIDLGKRTDRAFAASFDRTLRRTRTIA
jgi:hypothetical protein